MAMEKEDKTKEEEAKPAAAGAPAAPPAENAPGALKAILGEKLGMSQVFTPEGECRAVTLVKTTPCLIAGVKIAASKDGYSSVLLGYGARKEDHTPKPLLGNFVKAGLKPLWHLRELRLASVEGFKAGQTVGLDGRFAAGDYVDVQGVSKGKGFAGAMKRHHFRGLPASHGASDKERSPGSSASRRSLGRVLPGQRGPGHMGARTITMQKIEVVSIDAAKGLLFLGGSVPGTKGGLVVVKQTVKKIKHVRPRVSQTKKKTGFAGKVEASAGDKKK